MAILSDILSAIGIIVLISFFYIIAALVLRIRCNECNHKNGKRKTICSECGTSLINQDGYGEELLFDRKTIVLAFFFPPIAWYLYRFFKVKYPKKMQSLLTISIVSPFVLIFNLIGFFHAGNEFINLIT